MRSPVRLLVAFTFLALVGGCTGGCVGAVLTPIDGPAIYGAGAILSTTGGHGDLHSFPLDWMEDWTRRTGLMRLADGPDECVRATRAVVASDPESCRIGAASLTVHL